MGETTALEQQNHCSGISPYNGSNNNLGTTITLVECPPTMGTTTALEQQSHSNVMSPYNGSNNNLRTTESLEWNITLQWE